MIYGAKNWNDPGIRYDQENNILESFLKRSRATGNCDFSLESCNVEASCCAVEAVGSNFLFKIPPWMGQGDFMFDFLNSPKNLDMLLDGGGQTPPNEIIENLARAITKLSDAKAIVMHCNEWLNEQIENHFLKSLEAGHAIVLSYLTDYGSGHYITIVGYDANTGEFIVYDPWKGNKHCSRNGNQERYKINFFTARMRPRFMEVYI